MDVLHCKEMPWGESLVAQRGAVEGMAHKLLFQGDEHSPDNYMLVMSNEPKEFFSPRHRHAWDQIRYCLKGKIPISKGVFIEEGEIGYFPESTRYGPQEGGEDRIVLLLQFGGASRNGFIGPQILAEARLEMEQSGSFENGVYSTSNDGRRVNTDAYEAVWRHVKAGSLEYAPAIFKAPIIVNPENIPWRAAAEGNWMERSAGSYPHRGLDIRFLLVSEDAPCELPGRDEIRFLFVKEGECLANGVELREWSVVRLQPFESVHLETSSSANVLLIRAATL